MTDITNLRAHCSRAVLVARPRPTDRNVGEQREHGAHSPGSLRAVPGEFRPPSGDVCRRPSLDRWHRCHRHRARSPTHQQQQHSRGTQRGDTQGWRVVLAPVRCHRRLGERSDDGTRGRKRREPPGRTRTRRRIVGVQIEPLVEGVLESGLVGRCAEGQIRRARL